MTQVTLDPSSPRSPSIVGGLTGAMLGRALGDAVVKLNPIKLLNNPGIFATWIVAALAILVTGMTQSVRQQVRVTATTLDAVTAQAMGDGAIALTLQALQVLPQRPQQAVTQTVSSGMR